MIQYYNLNGERVPVNEAKLLVNDLAIIRGYGIFDYFLARRGQPLFIDDYLTRFYHSAEKMHMKVPLERMELHHAIQELIDANGEQEAGIRLVLTGGYADDGYTPKNPNLIILQHPMPRQPQERFDNGVKLITHRYERDVPEVKTINYLEGIRLLPELKKAGALEPLYHDGAYLTESVRSNFFLVLDDERIVTPDDKILFGITRKKVLEKARQHFEVEERGVRVEEFKGAREAFLTGSTKLLMPVVQVDDIVFGNGRPGPVTRKLMQLFEEATKEYLASGVR